MSSYSTEQATDPSIILITALFSMRRMSAQHPSPKVVLQNETQQAALLSVEEIFETFHCLIARFERQGFIASVSHLFS